MTTIVAGVACAGPITYTESGVVSGSIAGQNFTALITLTMVSDTANISAGATSYITTGTSWLSIPSLGITATPNDEWKVFTQFCACGGYGGFIDTTHSSYMLLTANSNAIGSYNLATAFGPETNARYVGGDITSTSAGILILNNDNTGLSTFTAQIGAFPPSGTGPQTPEPGTIILTAMGGLAIFATVAARKPRDP